MSNRQSPFGKAPLVNAKQLAEFLGCSAKQVRQLSAQGKLPKALRVGRLMRWPRQVIEQWLSERTAS